MAEADGDNAALQRQLEPSRRAREIGGRVVALTMPTGAELNMSMSTYCAMWLIPGWRDILALPPAEKTAKLRDPAVRAELRTQWDRLRARAVRRHRRRTASATRSPPRTGSTRTASSPTSPVSGASTPGTSWSTSRRPTTTARCSGRCGPRPLRKCGRCAATCGASRMCCSAVPTPARTSTGSWPRPIRRVSSSSHAGNGSSSRSRRRSTS